MTPEQKQAYKDTRRCPMCDGSKTTTVQASDDWEHYESVSESSLVVSKSCDGCGARWTEEYAYTLVDVSMRIDPYGVIVDDGALICPKCWESDEEGEPVTAEAYPDGYTCADCGEVTA